MALSPGSSEGFLISQQLLAPTHQPAGLDIVAQISRFKGSLSSVTTCFTFASRHRSKQNGSTLVWLQRIPTSQFPAAFASLSIVLQTQPQAPKSLSSLSQCSFCKADNTERVRCTSSTGCPGMTLFIFQSMPSLQTHSGFLQGQDTKLDPAELEGAMLLSCQCLGSEG